MSEDYRIGIIPGDGGTKRYVEFLVRSSSNRCRGGRNGILRCLHRNRADIQRRSPIVYDCHTILFAGTEIDGAKSETCRAHREQRHWWSSLTECTDHKLIHLDRLRKNFAADPAIPLRRV